MLVFGLVGLGDRGEGDFKGLGVNHAQEREGGLHLIRIGLRQSVGAPTRSRVSVRVRFLGGVGDDGGQGLLQLLLVAV